MTKLIIAMLICLATLSLDSKQAKQTKKEKAKPLKTWSDNSSKPSRIYAGECHGYIVFTRKSCFSPKLSFWVNFDNSCVEIVDVVDPDCFRSEGTDATSKN